MQIECELPYLTFTSCASLTGASRDSSVARIFTQLWNASRTNAAVHRATKAGTTRFALAENLSRHFPQQLNSTFWKEAHWQFFPVSLQLPRVTRLAASA